MAMTQLALLFLGALAGVTSIGLFMRTDAPTKVVLSFTAAVLWGVFGMSAFDVIIVSESHVVRSEPILPLAYLGLGLAFAATGFAIMQLIGMLNESRSSDVSEMIE